METLAYKKKYQPHQTNTKLGKGPEQACLQRRPTDVQRAHEEMLALARHQRHANQSHEISHTN